MQMTSLQKMAMDVFIPSWGEINLSLAAAVLFILLVSYFQHVLTGNDTSKDSGEENVLQLPAIPELENVVLNDPSAQVIAKVRTGELHRLLTPMLPVHWSAVLQAEADSSSFYLNFLQSDEDGCSVVYCSFTIFLSL
jgi:hypothetical protein